MAALNLPFQSASYWRRSGKLLWRQACAIFTAVFQSASYWRRSGKTVYPGGLPDRIRWVSIRIVLEKVWKVGGTLALPVPAGNGFQSASYWRRSGKSKVSYKIWKKRFRFNPHRIGEGLERIMEKGIFFRPSKFQSASYWRRSGKEVKWKFSLRGKEVSIRIVLEKVWKGAGQVICAHPHGCFNPHRIGEGLERRHKSEDYFRGSIVFQSASYWRRSGKSDKQSGPAPLTVFQSASYWRRSGKRYKREKGECRSPFQSASYWRRSGKTYILRNPCREIGFQSASYWRMSGSFIHLNTIQ